MAEKERPLSEKERLLTKADWRTAERMLDVGIAVNDVLRWGPLLIGISLAAEGLTETQRSALRWGGATAIGLGLLRLLAVGMATSQPRHLTTTYRRFWH